MSLDVKLPGHQQPRYWLNILKHPYSNPTATPTMKSVPGNRCPIKISIVCHRKWLSLNRRQQYMLRWLQRDWKRNIKSTLFPAKALVAILHRLADLCQLSTNPRNIQQWQRPNFIQTFHYQPSGCTCSISQEICTRFCCALHCCGYAIVHNEFTWSIYPYSSGLLCWHWGNR